MSEASGRGPIGRPCAAARFATPIAGQGYLKVPFARCGDGVARHVTAVAGLSVGPFHCLDCEEPLSLRRPRDKRLHFAHRPDSLCSGETALHQYAKELLARSKTLTLPALVLRDEGLTEIVFRPGVYDFETVVPERMIDTFRPDAIVFHKGAELAVEFLVSHAVDAEKLAKVRARDLSMVEIDLSGVRAGQLAAEQLDERILHSAPREWKHHRKRVTAARKLAEAVATKRAMRGARLRAHIKKRVRPAYPEGWRNDAADSVRRAGLEHLLGLKVDCAHWFTVPRAVWQAQALDALVIRPSELYSPGGNGIACKGEWTKERSLATRLPEWMIRTDLTPYHSKSLADAGYDKISYGSPDHAVWAYLAAPEMRETVFWNPDEQSFFIDGGLHGRLHRRVELRRVVTKLLEAVQHTNPDTGYRRWVSSHGLPDCTPSELVENGGDGYRELFLRLSAVEAMLPSYSRKVVDDLCGLPLEPIRLRNLAAMAADEEERARKAREGVDARRSSIRLQAIQILDGDAADWLAGPSPEAGPSMIEYAAMSDETLFRAERLLATAAQERRSAIAAAARVAELRAELSRAAQRAFPDPARAHVFLTTGQPHIGGKRPIDYCDGEHSFKILLSLLPKRR